MKKQLWILLAALMVSGPVSVLQAMDDRPLDYTIDPGEAVVVDDVVVAEEQKPAEPASTDTEGGILNTTTYRVFDPENDKDVVAIVEGINNKQGTWSTKIQPKLKEALNSTISFVSQTVPAALSKGSTKVGPIVTAFKQKLEEQIGEIQDPRERETYIKISSKISEKLESAWAAITKQLDHPISSADTDAIINLVISEDTEEAPVWNEGSFGFKRINEIAHHTIQNIERKNRGSFLGIGGTIRDNLSPAQKDILAIGQKLYQYQNSRLSEPQAINLAPDFINFLTHVINAEDQDTDGRYLEYIMKATKDIGAANVFQALGTVADEAEKYFNINLAKLKNIRATVLPSEKKRLQTEATIHTISFLYWIFGITTGENKSGKLNLPFIKPLNFVFNSEGGKADIDAITSVLNSDVMKNTKGNEYLNQLRAILITNLSQSLPATPTETGAILKSPDTGGILPPPLTGPVSTQAELDAKIEAEKQAAIAQNKAMDDAQAAAKAAQDQQNLGDAQLRDALNGGLAQGQVNIPAGSALTRGQLKNPMNIEAFKQLTPDEMIAIYETRPFTFAEENYARFTRGLEAAMKASVDKARAASGVKARR